MPGHLGEQWPPRGPDARIHHHDVNGLLRKIAVRLRDGERAVGDVVGLNAVADVDHLRGGLDAQDDAFHGANKMIGEAKVGGERDDGTGHRLNLHRLRPRARF